MQKRDNSNVVFPFWEGITFPFETIYKRAKEFCCLIGVYSLVAAVLVMIFGRSFACVLGLEGRGIYCLVNPFGVFFLFVLLLFMMACFINRWWLIAFKEMSFVEVMKIQPNKKDVKILFFLLMYLTSFLVIGVGIYLLYTRVATPNLNLELALFVGVSLCILMVLIILLNAVIFARFLDGKRWFYWGKTLLPVFDNIYKIVAWFLFYLLLFAYLVRQAGNVFFVFQKMTTLLISSFVGEIALQFVFYLIAAFIVSVLKMQENYIFRDKEN